MPNPKLHTLLREAFTAEQLRQLVATLPDGPALADELPGAVASKSQLAFDLVALLERYGRIDADLFDAIARERPPLRARVAALAATFGLALGPASLEPPRLVEPAGGLRVSIGTVSSGQGVVVEHGAQPDLDLDIQALNGGAGLVIRGPKAE